MQNKCLDSFLNTSQSADVNSFIKIIQTYESTSNITDYYNTLYTKIREDLENNDVLFAQLIDKFFRILERIIQMSQDPSQERSEKSYQVLVISTQDQSLLQSVATNSRCRRLSKTKYDANILSTILELQDHNIDFYLNLFLAMFKLLQIYLKFAYSPVFKI